MTLWETLVHSRTDWKRVELINNSNSYTIAWQRRPNSSTGVPPVGGNMSVPPVTWTGRPCYTSSTFNTMPFMQDIHSPRILFILVVTVNGELEVSLSTQARRLTLPFWSGWQCGLQIRRGNWLNHGGKSYVVTDIAPTAVWHDPSVQ